LPYTYGFALHFSDPEGQAFAAALEVFEDVDLRANGLGEPAESDIGLTELGRSLRTPPLDRVEDLEQHVDVLLCSHDAVLTVWLQRPAVTMISTKSPRPTRSARTQARTGGLSRSTHSFHAAL
jgi:hypothetical protein